MRFSVRMSLQDVYDATARVATAGNDSRFVVPPSRLSQIEHGYALPNIFRLYALAQVYRVPLERGLKFYIAS